MIKYFGDMAQLVERLVRNEEVTSSNLVISTRFFTFRGAALKKAAPQIFLYSVVTHCPILSSDVSEKHEQNRYARKRKD